MRLSLFSSIIEEYISEIKTLPKWVQERAPKMLKKSNQKGFSIIEVLIVLAIAGLIMLVVFLAVPALQRNARNNARQSEASVLSTAINDCVTNNNGKTTNCVGVGNSGTSQVPFDVATQANQLTVTPTVKAPPAGTISKAEWAFGYECSGSTPTANAAKPRAFVVAYLAETSNGTTPRCIQS